jgi:hypothetical protein
MQHEGDAISVPFAASQELHYVGTTLLRQHTIAPHPITNK